MRFRPSPSLVSAPILFLLVSCGLPRVTEKEPNDDFFRAQRLAFPCLVTADSSPGTDPDFYRLDGLAGTHLGLELEGSHRIEEVSVYDQSRRRIKRYEPGAGRVFRGSLVLPDSTAFLVVSAGGRRGRYELKVFRDERKNLESEPNDNARTASPLESGAAVTGDYEKGDEDWFRVENKERTVRSLECILSGTPGVDGVLEFYDPSGGHLIRVDNGGAGEGELAERINVLGGSWIDIRVLSRSIDDADRRHSYEIGVKLLATDRKAEREPNGSAANATPWPEGEPSQDGVIGWRGDRDLFRVEDHDPTRRTFFFLEGDRNLPLTLELWSEKGVRILSATGKPPETPVILANLNMGKSPVFLAVFSPEGRSGPGATYRLRRIHRDLSEGLEEEPNETPIQATPLASRVETPARLENARDVDCFRVASGASTPVEIITTDPERVEAAYQVGDSDSFDGVELSREGTGNRLRFSLPASNLPRIVRIRMAPHSVERELPYKIRIAP